MEKILATVNGSPITEREVDEFLAGLGQRGQSYNNPEGRKMVLNQIIGNKLLLLDAKRNLLEAEPEFKAELARLKDNLLVSYNTHQSHSKHNCNCQQTLLLFVEDTWFFRFSLFWLSLFQLYHFIPILLNASWIASFNFVSISNILFYPHI